jgi:hypothetical protein
MRPVPAQRDDGIWDLRKQFSAWKTRQTSGPPRTRRASYGRFFMAIGLILFIV